ncbi:hypothetical protein BY996DRAFT_8686039 [Phakopsora pachyrhizi]|nr:hypothetical protein BY996DRAFT_8695235 [Phakopsora pachyrhizi]KAI8455999.1 hypothetical protein BY996DRAFT_8686039 [Phakopsora pachyrhizi]
MTLYISVLLIKDENKSCTEISLDTVPVIVEKTKCNNPLPMKEFPKSYPLKLNQESDSTSYVSNEPKTKRDFEDIARCNPIKVLVEPIAAPLDRSSGKESKAEAITKLPNNFQNPIHIRVIEFHH